MADAVKDLATSLIVVAPSPATSGSSVAVTAGEGALFPSGPFDVLLQPNTGAGPTLATVEFARATIVGDVLTLSARGLHGTSAQAVAIGWRVSAPLTAEMWAAMQAQVDTNTAAIATNTASIAAEGTARASADTTLTAAVASKVASVTAADASVVIGGTATAPTVRATGTTSPDATASVKGIVQLAGDLAGTAALPTVPGLAGKVGTGDSRLTDARSPTAHKTSHATGGTDVLSPADIGAATAAALTAEISAAEHVANKGAANGYAALDGAGKLPASQLTVDAMEYKGTWNASTNSPALADASGSPGDFYIVGAGGTQNLGSGSNTYVSGDHVLLNPALVWERIPVGGAGGVASFNTRTGAVTLAKADVTGTGLAAADVGASQNLVRTAVKTSAYTAVAGDLVPCDISAGSFTVTLPAAPANGSRVAVIAVLISGTPGSTSLTVACGGTDTFNRSGGATSQSLTALQSGLFLQYDAGVWTVHRAIALAVANGAAQLGSDVLVPVAQLGTGTADATTFLRGDKVYAAPPGGPTVTEAVTGVKTFQGPGALFDDADTGAAARTFSLSPRVGVAGANAFTYPIPTVRPTTASKRCAFDLMPNGAPAQDALNGMCWLDVCNADLLNSNPNTGNVGTARVSCFTDHVEFGSHQYGDATNLDVWIAANSTGSSTPQIFINGTSGLVSIFSKTQQANTMLSVVPPASSYSALSVCGVTSQSADLFTAMLTQNGTRAWSVSATGVPKWGNANGQSTVGAAGAASALPATPSRYLKVVGDDGTSYVIPAYLP